MLVGDANQRMRRKKPLVLVKSVNEACPVLGSGDVARTGHHHDDVRDRVGFFIDHQRQALDEADDDSLYAHSNYTVILDIDREAHQITTLDLMRKSFNPRLGVRPLYGSP